MAIFSIGRQTINKIVRRQCKQSFNALERMTIRPPRDFHRPLAKSGAIGIRGSLKVQGIWSEANGLPVIHVRGYVYVWLQVRCLSRMFRK